MKDLISVIVVGIDFSPGAAVALREAIRLAEWNRSALHPVHIIDTLVAYELTEILSPFQKRVAEALVEDARKAWEAFSQKVKGAGVLPLDVRIDNRLSGLLAASREVKADLLVLGAYGDRKPEVGMGTVATACVRHAAGRVLLVRDTQSGPYKCVVACVDFSPTSLAALDQAARIAAQDGSRLHVLHVFDPPWKRLHYRSTAAEVDPQFEQQYRAGLERRLAAFSGELGREIDYLKPTYVVYDSHGHRSGIVEYARQVGADLISLGTRGRTSLHDLLLGTTAERALSESNCSVLAVKL